MKMRTFDSVTFSNGSVWYFDMLKVAGCIFQANMASARITEHTDFKDI